MKKIFQNKKLNRVSALVTAFLAAVVLPASLIYAWGPERETFTIEKPATFITFNSITNNPNYGDERNFVIAKDAANTSPGGWQDNITIEDGKEYLVRMYVHNNAADNLNLVAKNTRVMANVPNTLANSHQIDGFITADNAKPTKIWDSVVFKSGQNFTLKFISGSARYHNNVNAATGFTLPDSIVTSGGALVGYKSMNGDVPGCFQYSGIATFRLKAVTQKDSNFTVSKKVRKAGSTEWLDKINAKVGDKLEYRIGFDNVGQTVLNNVILRDTPPKAIIYTKGSGTLKNATNPTGNGKPIGNDGLITSAGVNIGNYTPSSNAFVYYSAVVGSEGLKCGTNRLVNTASASTDSGRKNDTAEVIVDAECKPNECKPGIPEGDERCEDTTVPGGTTPTELPRTGPFEVVLAIVGVALIVLGIAYWYAHKNKGKNKGPKQFIAPEGSDLATPDAELPVETETIKTDAPTEAGFTVDSPAEDTKFEVTADPTSVEVQAEDHADTPSEDSSNKEDNL